MSGDPSRLQHPAGEVSARLASRIQELVAHILPNGRRRGHEWIVGSVAGEAGSSCAVHLTGLKAGVWADFATGEAGDALDLVAAVCARGDRRHAYAWALAWLGLSNDRAIATRRVEPPAPDPAREQEAAAAETRRRRSAQMLWLRARPGIAGTPVNEYLLGRGIDLSRLGRVPRAIRFDPELFNQESGRAWPAMVAAISDGAGRHVATHRTWLARGDDGRWRKAPLAVAKMILGRPSGGSIRLWRGQSGKPLAEAPPDEEVVIGEGIETCLSVVVAMPERRMLCGVALPYIATIDLPEQVRGLCLLADNDVDPDARRGLERVVRALLATGRHVRIARSPWGKDFNDALLKGSAGRAA